MKQGHTVCRSELLRRRRIPIVGDDGSEMGTFMRPGRNNLLDGLIADRLAVEFALEYQPYSILLGDNINTLVTPGSCNVSVPADPL
jgi:hypothetical protein